MSDSYEITIDGNRAGGWFVLRDQRDAAVARAEQAEAERDEYRNALEAALAALAILERQITALDGEGPSTGYCCLSLEHYGTCTCDHAFDGEEQV